MYPDGAAARDKRLKPGDQILEVNGESFRNITHSRALAVLRQTPAKVRMMVYRDETSLKDDDMLDIIEVELLKKPGRGLGLSIVGRRNGPGVYISDVVCYPVCYEIVSFSKRHLRKQLTIWIPTGKRRSCGSGRPTDARRSDSNSQRQRLAYSLSGKNVALKDKERENLVSFRLGHCVINVDDCITFTYTQEQAAAILKTAMGKIDLKVGRLKAGAASPRSATSAES